MNCFFVAYEEVRSLFFCTVSRVCHSFKILAEPLALCCANISQFKFFSCLHHALPIKTPIGMSASDDSVKRSGIEATDTRVRASWSADRRHRPSRTTMVLFACHCETYAECGATSGSLFQCGWRLREGRPHSLSFLRDPCRVMLVFFFLDTGCAKIGSPTSRGSCL